MPDITALPGSGSAGICAPPATIEALLGKEPGECELLPFTIDGAPWLLINCLREISAFDRASSDLLVLEASNLPPIPQAILWINVTDSRALDAGIFTVESFKSDLLWTDTLVQRYRQLGLKGRDFKHVGYVVPDSAHAVPAPAPPPAQLGQSKYKGPKLRASPLPAEELRELGRAGLEMRQRMDLTRDAGAELVLERLRAEMMVLRATWSGLSNEQREDALLGLSAIFGDLLCTALGWSWVELRQGRNQRWIALLAPTGAHALATVPYFSLHIGSEEATTTLLFNMLASGELPPAEPGQIVPIG